MTLSRPTLLAALLLTAPAVAFAQQQTALFAGGCYWTVEAVFEHVRGVSSAVSGFATPADPDSATRARNHAGPAEAVLVTFDTTQVTYRQLLEVFFLAAHDPTQLDRQGPDYGVRYRSVVFVRDSAQRAQARAFMDELAARRQFTRPLVTEIQEARSFREARDQDFVARNPDHPYVVANDRPIIAWLRQRFPGLYRG